MRPAHAKEIAGLPFSEGTIVKDRLSGVSGSVDTINRSVTGAFQIEIWDGNHMHIFDVRKREAERFQPIE